MNIIKSIKSRSNRAFTLFEMLIVIALIGIGLGGLSWNLPKLLKKERFEKNVQRVCSKLTLAQEIMIDYTTDVTITFQPGEKGSLCRISSQCDLPDAFMKQINKEDKLPGINQVSFNNQSYDGVVTLHFFGAMGKIPKGILTLHGEKEISLTLPGYPSRITRTKKEEV